MKYPGIPQKCKDDLDKFLKCYTLENTENLNYTILIKKYDTKCHYELKSLKNCISNIYNCILKTPK